jgi:hypothetical protein
MAQSTLSFNDEADGQDTPDTKEDTQDNQDKQDTLALAKDLPRKRNC